MPIKLGFRACFMHFFEIIFNLKIASPCTLIHSKIKHMLYSFSSIDRPPNWPQIIRPLLICHEAKVCISVNMATLINRVLRLPFVSFICPLTNRSIDVSNSFFFNEPNRSWRVAVILMWLDLHPVQKQWCARDPCSYFRSLWSLFYRQGVPRARSKGV